MNFKPDEKDWMAYLYGELEGDEKERMEQYLLQHAEARETFAGFQRMRKALASVEDKEVIAPPIFIDSAKQRFLWNTPYFRTILSIAATLLLIILVGKATDTRISMDGNEFRLSFGADQAVTPRNIEGEAQPGLSADEVQQMINASLEKNNIAFHESLDASQEKLERSIKRNLAENSGRIDQLVRQASTASQEQIQQYVTTIQNQNMQMVKDYFQLTSGEQKKYIEDILVDFTRYMNQQRDNDLQLVQTQLNSLKQNSDVFQQETEQILTSIISSVNATPAAGSETRN